jgi:hypothetical protein
MSEPEPQQVVLTGIEIPYWDLVGFLFKLFFASLPLGIVLTIIWFLLTAGS